MDLKADPCCRSMRPTMIFLVSLLVIILFMEPLPGAAAADNAMKNYESAKVIEGKWKLVGNNSVITIACHDGNHYTGDHLLCLAYLTVDDLPEYQQNDVVFWFVNGSPTNIYTHHDPDPYSKAVHTVYRFEGVPLKAGLFWGQECKPGWKGRYTYWGYQYHNKYKVLKSSVRLDVKGDKLHYVSSWSEESGGPAQKQYYSGQPEIYHKQELVFERRGK